MTQRLTKPIFLSGASGFIGGHLYRGLVEAGLDVRCGTRDVARAKQGAPNRKWVEFDVERPETIAPALKGCGSAYYLVHQMGSGKGYRQRERRSALNFRRAAEKMGLTRIVYLGGVRPQGEHSEHLASRLETGRVLRQGQISTIELRASMIIGAGSASWRIVRDLAARLPVMILPRWTQSKTEPVYIDDVVVALLGALLLETEQSRHYDIPGPDQLTVEQILRTTARLMGHGTRGVSVPFLSPELSSHWLRFVTRGDLFLARELVKGFQGDLLAESDEFWDLIDHGGRLSFESAVRRTLDETQPVSRAARVYESAVGLLGRDRGTH